MGGSPLGALRDIRRSLALLLLGLRRMKGVHCHIATPWCPEILDEDVACLSHTMMSGGNLLRVCQCHRAICEGIQVTAPSLVQRGEVHHLGHLGSMVPVRSGHQQADLPGVAKAPKRNIHLVHGVAPWRRQRSEVNHNILHGLHGLPGRLGHRLRELAFGPNLQLEIGLNASQRQHILPEGAAVLL